jgi:alpha-tubulin suppressor-like RCC1 family protein
MKGCGENHTLFYTHERELKVCGRNNNYELGIGGNSDDVATPTTVSCPAFEGREITHISAGYHHSVVCIGMNDSISTHTT